jgi:putative glutamine amidotransferase
VRPLIGISSYGRAGGRLSFSVPCDYVDAVRAAGGIPVVLPPVEGDVPEIFAALDGLILSGGGDIDAAEYGQAAHVHNYDVNPERDRFELALARAGLAQGDLPMLCICRGMQVLNVVAGGDLVQHIPDRFGEQLLHRHPERKPIPHAVEMDVGCVLSGVASCRELTVQSWHHQAVDRVGHGLRAVAWAPDGVVEAVESTTHEFVVGVQWHPEIAAATDRVAQRLFETFVTRSAGSCRR